MTETCGRVTFHPLFTSAEIGARSDASVEQIVRRFLAVGEAEASRWIEMPHGILLLQTVPGNADSGAVYLYDRERGIFYLADFSAVTSDSFTVPQFEHLVNDYDLIAQAAHPELLPSMAHPGRA